MDFHSCPSQVSILELRDMRSSSPAHSAQTHSCAWMTPLPAPYAGARRDMNRVTLLCVPETYLQVSSREAETVYPWVLSDHATGPSSSWLGFCWGDVETADLCVPERGGLGQLSYDPNLPAQGSAGKVLLSSSELKHEVPHIR